MNQQPQAHHEDEWYLNGCFLQFCGRWTCYCLQEEWAKYVASGQRGKYKFVLESCFVLAISRSQFCLNMANWDLFCQNALTLVDFSPKSPLVPVHYILFCCQDANFRPQRKTPGRWTRTKTSLYQWISIFICMNHPQVSIYLLVFKCPTYIYIVIT